MGGKHQEHAREVAERLAAAGDASNDELRALLRDPKGNAMSWLAGAATLAILVLMIWKPGLMLAAGRPFFPLFLHVFGAMVLTGAVLVA